ncbi:MAG: hypothetical protein ACRDMV_17275 [Streptosporangiales bacterium]
MSLTADDRVEIHQVIALHGHLCDLTADIPTPLADWLTHHGWTLDPELRCPQRTCRST